MEVSTMNKGIKNLLKTLLTCMVVLGFIGGSTSFAGDSIVIKGSTTVLPVAQVASEGYMKLHPGINISLSGGGSGNGIKALIDGSTDIANASRFIKDKELKFAQ